MIINFQAESSVRLSRLNLFPSCVRMELQPQYQSTQSFSHCIYSRYLLILQDQNSASFQYPKSIKGHQSTFHQIETLVNYMSKELLYLKLYLNMASVKIEKSLAAARPLLILIQSINNNIPRTNYVVYYKNYTQQDEDNYKNIQKVKELFLPHQQLEFKIIDFEKQADPIYVKSSSFKIQNKKVFISAVYQAWSITLQGIVLNQSQQNEGVVDLNLISKEGYDGFYKFRKKYKTLQNLTKRLEFQIDHRIKAKIEGKQFQFNLQQKKKQHFYLSLKLLEKPITFVLEQITSIEDYINVEIIDQTEVTLNDLSNLDYGYNVKIKYSNMFQATFFFDVIINENLSTSQLVSIRLFQTSKQSQFTKIGNQHTINLSNCLKLSPLVGKNYYDYEWGYLNQNLNKIQGESIIYEHIDKLTPSREKYPHFINQQIIDLQNCNNIIFNVDGQIVKIPIVYVIRGLNFVENNKINIKFYIDTLKSLKSQQLLQEKSDHKRVYEMNLSQIVNLNKINYFLDKQGSNQFHLKIINQDTFYYVMFQRSVVNKSQFRKQVKQLATKQEIYFKNANQHCWLQNGPKNKDQLILIQSTSINPFYLISMTSSSSLSFQFIVNKSIIFEGSLSKQKIVDSKGSKIIHLISSLEGNIRIGISINFVEVKQANESASTFFNFRHRLNFTESGETQQIAYDVQIQFDKGSGLKNLRTKIAPQLKRQTNEGAFLKQFNGSSGVLVKQDRIVFTVKIKKMFYNQELNYFDNELLISKSIAINPNAEVIKQGKSLMLRLEKECYEGVSIDLYDSNIKMRMKYYLQIYAQKNQFLDYKDSSYKIKIPGILWEFSNQFQTQNTQSNFQIMTHLNRRRRNEDKAEFKKNSQQDIILDHYNYNDGISITKNHNQIGYSKVIKTLKLRCDILKDKIGWTPQSDWYFGVLSINQQNLYFMLQRLFDPYEEKKKDSDSDRSRKTVSRGDSARSDKHKIDPLAKTINNLDLFKLKKKKNDLIVEGRQLTARYVKRQQKVIELNKKLEELDQKMRKKEQQQKQKKSFIKKPKAQNIKMKEFYRSICECGERNPQFNGYCKNCLKNLKQRYEVFFKEYKQKSYEYEKMVFEQFNKKQKVERMKRRIHGLQNQDIVVQNQDGSNIQYLMKDMQEKSIKKHIQELKVELFELQEEKSSLLQVSNWQMTVLEQKISQQDALIYKHSQQYNTLKNQHQELLKMIKNEAVKAQ